MPTAVITPEQAQAELDRRKNRVTPGVARQRVEQRKAARARLMPFCRFTFPGYMDAEHLNVICDGLEALERADIRFLLIVAPPRHAKTEHASIRFPAWIFGRHPDDQVMSLSYSDGMAYSNAMALRGTMQSPEYQELWPLKFKTTGVMEWQLVGKTDMRPSYRAAGVGGGITGKGADWMIVDDLIKNRQEADSPTKREHMWLWYTSTARTRLEPGGRIAAITTRWHEDDWAGRVLKAMVDPLCDQWHVIHLQAITEGKALWPERYPIESLENIRATIGSRDFETIYQGNPRIAEGNIFKREWFKFIDEATFDETPLISTVQVYDTAFKSGEENDYSVCLTMHLTQRGYVVSNMWRAKVTFPDLETTVKMLYQRDRPGYVLVEDKASGQDLIPALQRNSTIPIKGIQAKGDKVSRANSVTGLVESGRVSLVEGPWNHDFVEELCGFPSAAHDDIVDTFVHGMTFLRQWEAPSEPAMGVPGRSRWR